MRKSSSRRFLATSVATSLLVAAGAAVDVARASDPLNHIPADALGFIRVNRLAATDAKIQQLIGVFQVPIPAPLSLLKLATGIDQGLDLQGDALVAFLPGDLAEDQPIPMLLIPTDDYPRLVEPFQGDPSGEICRVAVAGEEVLIAQDGSFALLMNLEHRELMEAVLPAESPRLAALQPVRQWIGENNVVGVLMPTAVTSLVDAGTAELERHRQAIEDDMTDPELEELYRQLQQSLETNQRMLEAVGREVRAACVGVALDEGGNLRVSKKVVLARDGTLAKLAPTEASDWSPLANFQAGPFVAAGGGPFPAAWADPLATLGRQVTEQFAASMGLEGLREEDWRQSRASWELMLKGLRGFSMIVRPGDEEGPLFDQMGGVLEVDDSTAYLAALRQSYEAWNGLSTKSNDIKLEYKISDARIADRPALHIEADQLAALGKEERNPFMRDVMERMFGKDGITQIYAVAADDRRVVVGMGQESWVASLVQDAQQQDERLGDAELVIQATQLLDDDSQWRFVTNPQTAIDWARRFLAIVAAGMGGGEPPPFPSAAAIGVSVEFSASQVTAETVFPNDALAALAEYVRVLQER